jgi:hypothetical protein
MMNSSAIKPYIIPEQKRGMPRGRMDRNGKSAPSHAAGNVRKAMPAVSDRLCVLDH